MKLEKKTIVYIVAIFVSTIIVVNVLFKKPKMEDLQDEKTWNNRTNENIQKLHPLLRSIATNFVNLVAKRLDIYLIITDGFRTFAQQNTLYAKGRTTGGKKVTNSKGGESYHNYGLAFDCYLTKNGQVDFSKPINSEIAKIGQELGLEWGGAWKSFKDFPHFQLNKGTVSQLLALHNQGKKDSQSYVIV